MKPLLWLALVAGLCRAETPPGLKVIPGDGPRWKRHTIDHSSRGADGVKLGDIDRDGLPDIVTGWEEGGEVRVYLNPGPKNSAEPWPRVTVGKVANVEEAIFVDLDGDGRLEVLSGTEGKNRTVYWHRFTGSPDELLNGDRWSTTAFPATEKAQMWMQAAALQLDGQNGTDLLLASKNETAAVGWLQAPPVAGDVAGWKWHQLREAGWVMSLTPHDMDGDGDDDAVFTDRKGKRTGVFWLENPGAAANVGHLPWREHPIGAREHQVMFADLGDLNGDGLIDVATAAKPVTVFLSLRTSSGGWQERVVELEDANLGDAKAVKIADVNMDKLPDLIFTCENAKQSREGIVWLEQRADGTWVQHPLGGPEGVKYDLMQTLDLDGDGDLDVITCEERDQLGVIWYENPHLSHR